MEEGLMEKSENFQQTNLLTTILQTARKSNENLAVSIEHISSGMLTLHLLFLINVFLHKPRQMWSQCDLNSLFYFGERLGKKPRLLAKRSPKIVFVAVFKCLRETILSGIGHMLPESGRSAKKNRWKKITPNKAQTKPNKENKLKTIVKK